MSNDAVISALQNALAESPDDVDVRIHLIELLLESGAAESALEHCNTVLAAEPANARALTYAAKAADASGDEQKAASFRTLAKAVSGESEDGPVAVPLGGKPQLRVVGGNEPFAEEADGDEVVTLADVAGLADVKKRLDFAFLGPIRNPELARAYGKKLRGGLMLYGPPGCGKTYIARALAGELGASFVSVGLNDVLDMWMGESEKRLHAIFENARESAPTVLFFDELDAIGRKRADLGTSATREVVNQLLAELDGASTGDSAVFVLGATNLPWDVDTALKRPGRFDRSIFVCPPDLEARQRILELNLEGRPTDKLSLSAVAKKTAEFSGADIAHICETATEMALARAMDSGTMEPISDKDLAAAMKEISPSIGRWFQSAKNYALFANNSGEFNDLAEYITAHRL
jgi:SpoVK/Ycf46/Vps4 family AAA+-type ATPase